MKNNNRDLINVAQFGVGYWGPNLLRNLVSNPRFNVKAVVDLSETRRDFVTSLYPGIPVDSTPEAVFENPNIDAVVIATPVTTHYDLAIRAVKSGKHVLVEKPMTEQAAQAAELVQLAQENNCVLQVGHVERFNPVFDYLHEAASDPRFIETHRLSPYPTRSIDIGVVLDLMIHDLDAVMAFVN